MKIALTATQYNRHGGEARYSVELAENLYKKGHEVHVYTSKISTKSEGITFHYLPNIPTEYPRVLSYIPYFVQNCLNFRSHDFDIVHTAGNESLYQDIITTHSIHAAGMEYKKKYGLTGMGVLDKTILTIEKYIYTKRLFKKAICASESTKAELMHFYKVPEELIEVIPYGVNPEEFYPYDNKDSDKITLMIVATEFLRKGVPELIQATNILAKRHDIRLMVVGSPSVEGNSKGKSYYDLMANKNIIFTSKVDNLNDYYNMSDIFVFPTKYEAFGLCLHPTTNIICIDGTKKISEIQINDSVLTHKGIFKKVSNKMKRTVNEELVCITPYNLNREIKLTKEHPILAIKRPNKRYKKDRKWIQQPKWIKAGDIKKGDIVVMPITKHNEFDDKVVYDISEYGNVHDSNKIWRKHSYPLKREKSISYLMNKYGETKMVIENGIKKIKHNDTARIGSRTNSVMDKLKFEDGFFLVEPIKVNRFIELDTVLAYVMGWYVAEGYNGDRIFSFCMHKKEIPIAEEIKKVIKDKFGIDGTIYLRRENGIELTFSNIIVKNFFREECGDSSQTVHIPLSILYNKNKEILRKFLEGLYLGDGCLCKTGWNTLTTVSERLKNDVIIGLLRLGLKPRYLKYDGEFNISYKKLENYVHSNKSWVDKDYIYLLVRNVEKEYYQGKVYNLEIEEDNSYCTESFCVHNCTLEAMSCGLPVITTNIGAGNLITNHKDGVWFDDPTSVDDIVNKIEMVIQDEQLRKRLSKEARKIAMKYTWEKMTKKTMDIYDILQ